jgi:hypothetical protein
VKLPFTLDQFISVFKEYNLSVWPMQIVLNAIAIGIIVLLFLEFKQKSRDISLLLAVLWGWTGIVYHIIFFSTINPAARIFGVLFIIQSLIFLIFGALIQKIKFDKPSINWRHITGAILIVYALLIYPLLGMVQGHVYPNSPTFGLPCPTTIFSIGLLLFANPTKWYVMIVPILWSIIGGSAALKLGIREDFGLIISGIIMILWSFQKRDGNDARAKKSEYVERKMVKI